MAWVEVVEREIVKIPPLAHDMSTKVLVETVQKLSTRIDFLLFIDSHVQVGQ